MLLVRALDAARPALLHSTPGFRPGRRPLPSVRSGHRRRRRRTGQRPAHRSVLPAEGPAVGSAAGVSSPPAAVARPPRVNHTDCERDRPASGETVALLSCSRDYFCTQSPKRPRHNVHALYWTSFLPVIFSVGRIFIASCHRCPWIALRVQSLLILINR